MPFIRRSALLLIATGLCAGFAIAWRAPHLLADETYYGPQIRWFMEGRFELVPGITMIPAYHLVVASIAQLCGPYSDRLARATSFLGALALVPITWHLASAWSTDKPIRVVQVIFQPLLYPYLFLIYTEAWSLAALGTMLLALARRRFWIAAGAGAVGVLIRQDFVIWVAMGFAMATLTSVESFDPRKSWRGLMKSAVEASPLLLVLLGFLGFVAWNGGVALGDRASHPPGGVNLTNLYFMLICGWLVFLPVALDCLPEIRDLVRRPWVALALAAGFALYLATYSNPHIYNQAHLRFFVHNEVLHWMTHSWWVRAILFVPLAWMLLACVIAARKRPVLRIPMLFAAVSVVLHPLIEQRYYLPAFFIFNLARAPVAPGFEAAMVILYVPVALALLYGMVSGRFFL